MDQYYNFYYAGEGGSTIYNPINDYPYPLPGYNYPNPIRSTYGLSNYYGYMTPEQYHNEDFEPKITCVSVQSRSADEPYKTEIIPNIVDINLVEYSLASKIYYQYMDLAMLQMMNTNNRSDIKLKCGYAKISYEVFYKIFSTFCQNRLQQQNINESIMNVRNELKDTKKCLIRAERNCILKSMNCESIERELGRLKRDNVRVNNLKDDTREELQIANAKVASLMNCHIYSDWHDVELASDESSEFRCNICFINRKQIVFGCGHYCCCFDCSRVLVKKTRKCPICRSKIESAIRIFI